MNVYFLSGIAADGRLFKKVILPSEFKVKHINWISPLRNESLEEYTRRLFKDIDLSEPFCLVGLSFGGIIASELAKIHRPQKIILISSISTYKQIPWYFRLAGSIGLHRLVPLWFLKWGNAFTYWIFGAKTEEERLLLKGVFREADNELLRWSIQRVVNWKHEIKHENIFHIHGADDKLLPVKYTNAEEILERGGHLGVYREAGLVTKWIVEVLSGDKNLPGPQSL